MPAELTAAEVQSFTWEQLNERLMGEPSIANGGNKRMKMQMHGDGSATISANHNVFSNAAEQQTFTAFVQATIVRSLAPAQMQGQLPQIAQALPADGVLRANSVPALNGVVENARRDAWDARIGNNVHVQAQPFANPSVAPLLQAGGTQIRPAGAGSGGALLATNPNPAIQGALLKTEPPVVMKGATLVATLGNNLPQNLKDAMPFGMVNYQAVPTNDPARALTLQALQDQHAALGVQLQAPGLTAVQQNKLTQTQGSIQNAITDMQRAPAHNRYREVGRMELVPDSVQLNDLPLQDKLALYKSPEFAQKLGQSMAFAPMLGLNDHIGPGDNTNASNFMINPQTGALTAIDYAAHFTHLGVGVGSGPGGGDFNYGRPGVAQDMVDLQAYAASVVGDAATAAVADTTMQAVTGLHNQGGADSLFSAQEMLEFNRVITPQERQAFEQNLKIGVGQGLLTIGQNINQLEQAYQNLAVAEGINNPNQRPFVTQNDMQQIANTLGVNLNVGVGGPPVAVGVGGGPPAPMPAPVVPGVGGGPPVPVVPGVGGGPPAPMPAPVVPGVGGGPPAPMPAPVVPGVGGGPPALDGYDSGYEAGDDDDKPSKKKAVKADYSPKALGKLTGKSNSQSQSSL